MQIIKKYPPNYESIKEAVNPPKDSFFPFGDKLYNPSGVEIPEDVMYHEQVHQKQQSEFTNPSIWWENWLSNREFRLSQEVVAFAHQLAFVKKYYPRKALGEALDEFSDQLANNYNLGINIYQASTLIRKCPTNTFAG